jgi:hypothetical protein
LAVGQLSSAALHPSTCAPSPCPFCSQAAATAKDKQLVLHGGGAAPGKITAEAKAALTGTVMVPTAAGGQVRVVLISEAFVVFLHGTCWMLLLGKQERGMVAGLAAVCISSA